MIIDKLNRLTENKSPVCVGLDTQLSYVPEVMREQKLEDSLFNFNKEIIQATKDIVACYKVQIGFYEQYGLAGMTAYAKTLAYLRQFDLFTIGDVKRGDIASTAEAYARAHFTGDFEVDMMTVNPYMGYDSLEAYLPYLQNYNKGIFVLIRTSNPGAHDIEYLPIKDQALYEKIADDIQKIAQDYKGASGFSSIGFVFGGTQSDNIEAIRHRYADIPFLIPGYGAQAGQASDIKKYLKEDGQGGVVNASRSIILAYQDENNPETEVGAASRSACQHMIKNLKK